MILLFNTLMLFVLLIAFPVILSLVLTSEKRRKTVLQRLGFGQFPKQKSKKRGSTETEQPVWVHALSVGETFSSIELVKTLRKKFNHRKIYFSVSTATGFDEARKRLAPETDHIFFYPYDLVFVVRKIIRRVSPSLFVLVESDLWPTFLLELKKMNVPSVLVNARLSSGSFVGYKRFSMIMLPVLNTFEKICVQSEEQGRRFMQIGVKPNKICVTGNLKFDQKPDTVSTTNRVSMKKALAISENSKVFLAGSTHPGEEKMLLESFKRLKSEFPELVMIIAPRNPERADEICGLAMGSGLTAAKMGQKETNAPEVIVVDTMGILGRLYAIADIAFVGGSLVNFGGHNPLEPAIFAKPILFGIYMSDFPEISQMLLRAKGAVQVKNPKDLYHRVRDLLTDPAKGEIIGTHAFEVFQANQGAVEKTAAVIKQIDRYFHEQ